MDNQNPIGQPLNQPNNTDNPPPPSPLPPNVPQVISSGPKPKKRWPKILGVFIVIALLVAAGWYFFVREEKKDNQPVATSSQNKDIPLLRIGIESPDYGGLYPNISVSEYSFLSNAQIFEGLVRYENKSKIVPALATDWTNPDAKTWIFTVNTNIKFHDGNTLSANDVKYSLDKIKASKSDFANIFAASIDSVTTTDNNKVKITTKDPDPTLLNRLAFLYIIDANAPKDSESSMAGTGPYMIKSGTKPTKKKLEMVAFDDYHDGRPATRELVLDTEQTADLLIKAYNEGKYDIIGSVPSDKVDKARVSTRFISSEPNVNFLTLNTVRSGPLQNIKVREAIRYAVDGTAVAKARGSAATPISQMVPEAIPGYNPAIPVYKRDTEKAKQLLAQAGYKNGLKLRFSSADLTGSNQEIARQLKEVGITVETDVHKDFDEYIDYFLSGKPEMYVVDYTSDTLDGLDIYQTAMSDVYYKNSKFSKLLDQASKATDPATRLKILQDVALVVDKDVPVVPLNTPDDLWLMNKDYDITQDMPSSFMSVYFYKVKLK